MFHALPFFMVVESCESHPSIAPSCNQTPKKIFQLYLWNLHKMIANNLLFSTNTFALEKYFPILLLADPHHLFFNFFCLIVDQLELRPTTSESIHATNQNECLKVMHYCSQEPQIRLVKSYPLLIRSINWIHKQINPLSKFQSFSINQLRWNLKSIPLSM